MVLLRGLPSYKSLKGLYVSAMCNGKSKKKPHKPKSKDTNQEKLYLLHMDLCGPMRVTSVNGKKYILVIVDDYSRFIRVKYLRSKDEAPDFIIKFLKMIQVRLKVPVRRIRIDNGTEFVNQTLRKYYEKVGISHETSGVRSLQQNSVVERSNHTLIEAARTMLIYAKALLFVWAEAVATAYFDELTAMASEHSSSGPVLHEMTHVIISSGLCPKPPLNIVAMYHLQELIGILCFNHSRTRFAFILVLSIPQQLLAKMHQHLVTHKQHTETQSPVIPNVLKEDIQTLDVCIHDNDPFFDALESLKKYGMESSDPVDTPMVEKSKLDEDTQGKVVDPTHYRGMIDTLVFLKDRLSRLDCAGCKYTRRKDKRNRLLVWLSKGRKALRYLVLKAIILLCLAVVNQIFGMDHSLPIWLGFNNIPIFHFIKEQVENGVVELYFVNTEYQLADIFTKALCRERIEFLINKLGMRSILRLRTLKNGWQMKAEE
ncbi:retrovirus-related pol polyprotein from transposon TNT 1-94 [Tanacetum coccineum]